MKTIEEGGELHSHGPLLSIGHGHLPPCIVIIFNIYLFMGEERPPATLTTFSLEICDLSISYSHCLKKFSNLIAILGQKKKGGKRVCKLQLYHLLG